MYYVIYQFFRSCKKIEVQKDESIILKWNVNLNVFLNI